MVLLVSQPGISSQTWKRRGIKPSAEFIILDVNEKLYHQKTGLHPCVLVPSCFPCTFTFPYGRINFLETPKFFFLAWRKNLCLSFKPFANWITRKCLWLQWRMEVLSYWLNNKMMDRNSGPVEASSNDKYSCHVICQGLRLTNKTGMSYWYLIIYQHSCTGKYEL